MSARKSPSAPAPPASPEPPEPPSLTLTATLLGNARTADANIREVTLKIQQDILTLHLTPDLAAVFAELTRSEGGAHPTLDPHRIVYLPAPLYRVVITAIEPEPTAIEPPALAASAAAVTSTSEPESTPAPSLAAAAAPPTE
jgi:hypothetical protein